MQCCICGGEIEVEPGGWDNGHNAEPVADGRCCRVCNEEKVLPARVRQIRGAPAEGGGGLPDVLLMPREEKKAEREAMAFAFMGLHEKHLDPDLRETVKELIEKGYIRWITSGSSSLLVLTEKGAWRENTRRLKDK